MTRRPTHADCELARRVLVAICCAWGYLVARGRRGTRIKKYFDIDTLRMLDLYLWNIITVARTTTIF
jgi:hypothetical protein